MGAMKRGLEDLSVALGFDGVITGEVLAVGLAEELVSEDQMITREQMAAGVAESLARECGNYLSMARAVEAAGRGQGLEAIFMGGGFLVVREGTAEHLAALGCRSPTCASTRAG
jgi:hypothetical protein